MGQVVPEKLKRRYITLNQSVECGIRQGNLVGTINLFLRRTLIYSAGHSRQPITITINFLLCIKYYWWLTWVCMYVCRQCSEWVGTEFPQNNTEGEPLEHSSHRILFKNSVKLSFWPNINHTITDLYFCIIWSQNCKKFSKRFSTKRVEYPRWKKST